MRNLHFVSSQLTGFIEGEQSDIYQNSFAIWLLRSSILQEEKNQG